MDDKELCNLACNPSLDGYTPNPLYHAGYCPDYMEIQCNADGSMFEEQWEKHQDNIQDFNARKIMAMTFHQKPQEYRYASEAPPLPPSSADVYKAMYSKIPIHPAINSLPPTKKSVKKSVKKPSKRSTKKSPNPNPNPKKSTKKSSKRT